ncbi:MAG: hypothetical protein ACFFD7_00735 [Candidatus Thorarchaeota archaeon]
MSYSFKSGGIHGSHFRGHALPVIMELFRNPEPVVAETIHDMIFGKVSTSIHALRKACVKKGVVLLTNAAQ